MLRAHIITLAKFKLEFSAGKMELGPIVELEALVLQRMLYAEKLPEAMRKNLVMEIYTRYKKLLFIQQNKYFHGAGFRQSVDAARDTLKRFMKEYNISEPQGETL